MLGRIVEVSTDGRQLSVERGFLVVSAREGEVGRTPIDDVAALIGNAHGLTYSNNLLAALAERAIPFVVCGPNHAPLALLWPVDGHHRQGARMDGQVRATQPQKKRLWRDIVQCKIGMQAAVLDLVGRNGRAVRRLVDEVRVGDPGNTEGRAAAAYWPRLFGRGFRRDRTLEGVNALLNYGYTVLRATVARHTMAAGLHPNIPVHHANEENSMRLVDDLMEPFRPLVDAWVLRLADAGRTQLDPPTKRALALLPLRTVAGPRGSGPLTLAVQRLAVSLGQTYEGAGERLALPPPRAENLAHLFDEPGTEGTELEEPAPPQA